ncbi:MAG: universal stress protein, partial [Microthrixaceae bacterium]
TGSAMARRAEAELLVVHVARDAERAAQRQVELKDALAQSDLVGEIITRWGEPPAAVISEVASADPASVVCMATRAPGRLGGAVLGSTAEAVLRNAAAPVLPPAAEWADALGMRMRLLHVLNPVTTRELRAGYPEIHFRDDSYVRSVAVDLGSTWETGADVEVLYGARPAAAISAFLESHPTTLPFLGTHGRTGLGRLVMGSVSTRVVHDSPGPVAVAGTSACW